MRGSPDIRMMRRDEDDLRNLLESWRTGSATRRDLYLAVRVIMYQAARRGIGAITCDIPDEQDVEDVVYQAFCEFEAQDPAAVRRIVALAWQVAYRRGQDVGRAIIRSREQIRGHVQDRAIRTNFEFSDEDARAAAQREVLIGYAIDCLDLLPDEQRDVVRATVMGRETLSDWAFQVGKSHQAASRQCARALRSLARCVKFKRDAR